MGIAAGVKQVLPNPVKSQLKRIFQHSPEPPPEPRRQPFEFWIDVVSGCNLRCAACPVGMPQFTNSIGQQLREMSLDLFEQICVKAKADTNNNCRFGLYNWTEPTLHSRLHELIACANRHEIPCGISSNLNHPYDWNLLKPLKLCNFTITVSGFTQKIYAINHRGGRIEPVLANLVKISDILGDWESYDKIDVRYLVHRENIDEVRLFRHFCKKLGMKFTPYHAYYMPIDKMFEGLEKIPEGLEYIAFSPKKIKEAIGSYRSNRCSLRDSQVVLDVDANFGVCCVESPSAPPISNFLKCSFKEMQASRFSSDLCKKCIKEGVNIFATYGAYESEEIQSSIQNALPFSLSELD